MCLSHRHEHGLVGFSADDRLPYAEPGVEASYGPDRTVAIEHIALRLNLWPSEQRFDGSATIRFRQMPAYSGVLVLDLDEVTVEGVTDADGGPLLWRTEGGKLRVDGAKTAVIVHWRGENPRHGLYFTGPVPHASERPWSAWTQCQDEDAHFVFPCHDHPRTKHAWSIELEGPPGYTLLSNGVRVGGGDRNGRSWAQFEQREPMPAYLLTAVAAKLTTIETSWRDKPVRYLVPVGDEEAVQRAMGRTPEMMELFSTLTGTDYPWPRYDQVVVHEFVFGGMENTACTTMTRLLLVDQKAALEWEADSLVSHELAHQWFGDLVTCQDWSQGWLNESWATFMEAVWFEHARDAASATWLRHDLARSYFEEEGSRYRRPIVSYDFKEPIDVFDRHLYEKGACVLATLRNELGADAFWAGVKVYLASRAHKTAHTRDFQRALEDTTGRNLDRFFQQWIFSPGHPVLNVKIARDGDLLCVTVKQKQTGDGVPNVYAFPLHIEVIGTDGRTTTVDLQIADRERTFAVPLKGVDVSTVRVDPGFRVLSRLELEAPREWLERLLSDACPVLASRAARALLDEGSAAAFRAVVKARDEHPFYGVRADLAAQIGRRGGEEGRDAMLAALNSEKEPRARRAVVDALGQYRDTKVVDALITVLGEDLPTWHLLGSALTALGKTRDPRAATVIREHLGTPSWAQWVRRRAVDALAQTRDPGVFDDIASATHVGKPGRVRMNAATALASLAEHVPAVRDRAVERLIEMLGEPGFFAQLGAATALATLRDDRALPALTRLHRTAADGRVRRGAYEAIARTQRGRAGDDAIGGLRTRLDDLAEENHKLRTRLDRLEVR